MPIWDYQCQSCGHVFESIEVWSHHKATECPECKSEWIEKIISSFHYRDDPDAVKHNLPDVTPPLEELRGRTKEGCEGGFKDKPYAETNLGKYNRKRDKNGNTIWLEKETKYFT